MVDFQVKNINFSYTNGFSLKDISFSMEEGRIYAILGPNASGKTTLIKYLSGIFGLNGGEVIFNEGDIAELDQKELAKIISYVPQIHQASFPYSVLDMVLMGRNPYIGYFSSPSKEDINQSVKALSLLGIENIKENPYTEISGGQQKIVLIARALAQNTPIMMLDEPTAHLDYRNKLFVLKIIKKLVNEKKIMVLMSLHDPNEAAIIADRILIINQGKIITKGNPDDVLNIEIMKEIYGLDVNITTIYGKKIILSSLDSIIGDDY